MEEIAITSADAPQCKSPESQYDGPQAIVKQVLVQEGPHLPLTTDTSPLADSISGRMTISTLREEIAYVYFTGLDFASDATLRVALTHLREEYGAEITGYGLTQSAVIGAIEDAMAETGEMNLETIYERLAAVTGVDTWLIVEWLAGPPYGYPLRGDIADMAACMRQCRPELVIKFQQTDTSYDMIRRVAKASGVLTQAEIAWISAVPRSLADQQPAVSTTATTKVGKPGLTDAVVNNTSLTKKDAGVALGAALDIIAEALRSGRTVGLPGVGTFAVKATAARQSVHPGTGEKIQIAAGKKVSFRVASDLKKSL